jgi:hypothetical protein
MRMPDRKMCLCPHPRNRPGAFIPASIKSPGIVSQLSYLTGAFLSQAFLSLIGHLAGLDPNSCKRSILSVLPVDAGRPRTENLHKWNHKT